MALIVLALGGCDRRERSRNAGGSLREADPPATTSAPNVYRFASSEQSLADVSTSNRSYCTTVKRGLPGVGGLPSRTMTLARPISVVVFCG